MSMAMSLARPMISVMGQSMLPGGDFLLLDTLAVQPVAAYSLRKLRTAYAGSAIRVRRSSDNAEQDIGFVAGRLDTASLLTFTGAGNGFVVTWYGQHTGAALNPTQATAANQPQIVSAGVLVAQNSRPAILGDATDTLSTTMTAGSANQLMICLVQVHDGTVNGYSVMLRDALTGIVTPHTSGYLFDTGGNRQTANSPPSVGTVVSLSFLNSTTLNIKQAWQNNVQLATSTAPAGDVITNQVTLFGGSTNRIHEVLVFDTEAGIGQRATINTNQMAFYP